MMSEGSSRSSVMVRMAVGLDVRVDWRDEREEEEEMRRRVRH